MLRRLRAKVTGLHLPGRRARTTAAPTRAAASAGAGRMSGT
jgi:hypothetical protein